MSIFSLLPKDQNCFQVMVVDSENTLYNGKVQAISSINNKGPFDILNLHSNFISIIHDQLVLREDEAHKREFNFTRAIMRCFNNEVSVYIGI